MAYNLIKTNGSQLVTVPDGQIDATATSITLVGKNYPGYGQFVNENMVKLLENFSNSSAPNAPLQGQLWFNEATKILSVYSSGAWKSISGAQNTPDEPVNKVAGDLWFDSVNQQLKVYSGTAWILIGPSFTSATGASGAFAETVTDTSSRGCEVPSTEQIGSYSQQRRCIYSTGYYFWIPSYQSWFEFGQQQWTGVLC